MPDDLEVAVCRALDDLAGGVGPDGEVLARAVFAVLDLRPPASAGEDPSDRGLVLDGWETCRNQVLYALGEALGVHRA